MPVVVANVTILTDFVILEMPEDDNMSIILGRPFLNTAGAVIDCNKSKVTFHINGNEHTVHFPKKQFQVNGINVIEKSLTIIIGSFKIPLPTVKKKYEMLIVVDMHIPIEVTYFTKVLRFHANWKWLLIRLDQPYYTTAGCC